VHELHSPHPTPSSMTNRTRSSVEVPARRARQHHDPAALKPWGTAPSCPFENSRGHILLVMTSSASRPHQIRRPDDAAWIWSDRSASCIRSGANRTCRRSGCSSPRESAGEHSACANGMSAVSFVNPRHGLTPFQLAIPRTGNRPHSFNARGPASVLRTPAGKNVSRGKFRDPPAVIRCGTHSTP
jgi:hypothetical protein